MSKKTFFLELLFIFIMAEKKIQTGSHQKDILANEQDLHLIFAILYFRFTRVVLKEFNKGCL